MKIILITKPDSKYGKLYGEGLLGLHNELYDDQHEKLDQLNGRQGFSRIDALTDVWDVGTLCACAVDDNNRPVGFITFSYTKQGNRFLWVHNFFVLEAHRSSGVGQTLIDTVRDYGKSKGCKWMQLTVLDNNSRAIAFYERYGFRTEYQDMVKEL